MASDVELRVMRFDDAALASGGEGFEYHYSGWIYELLVEGTVYGLRRYEDTREEISFHGTKYAPTPEDELDGFKTLADEMFRGGVPYGDPTFAKAVRWLLARPGIEKITVLCSDPEYPQDAYVPVDPNRLTH